MRALVRLLLIGAVIGHVTGSPVRADLSQLEDVFSVCQDSDCYVQLNLLGGWQNLSTSGSDPFLEQNFVGSGSDPAVGLGGAVGRIYCLDPCRIRAEIEANWLGHYNQDGLGTDGINTTAYKVGITQWSTMANLWADAPLVGILRGYAGGGIGVVGTDILVRNGGTVGEGSSTQFAWQVGTGLTVPITDDLEFDAGYRYLDSGTTSAQFGGNPGGYTADLTSHQLMLSLRWIYR